MQNNGGKEGPAFDMSSYIRTLVEDLPRQMTRVREVTADTTSPLQAAMYREEFEASLADLREHVLTEGVAVDLGSAPTAV